MRAPGIPDILARILERKREEVADGTRATSLAEMRRRAADAPARADFGRRSKRGSLKAGPR